ncbi:endonuclease [Halobacteriales archaeon SW_7_68_16]|nr:MAG: endonuclease [Halobacteriales archaeon SW_7_68_16]
MHRIVVVLAVVVFAGCVGFGPGSDGTAEPASEAGATATIVEVVDGDTVEIRYSDGREDTVRLLGVDTPEVRGAVGPDEFGVPDTESGRACLREVATGASAYARDRLAGREVVVRTDPTADRRGYYGRLLAYVIVDGESFNRALLADGYARVYESTFTERETYRATVADARAAGRGYHACPGGGTPATAVPGGLSIVTINADAAGPDARNPNDEYVVVANGGDGAIALDGYTLRDEVGHTYRFPNGSLGPGDRVTIHTGCGTDSDADRYWCRSRPVWNNDGDTAILAGPAGATVDRQSTAG